MTVYCGLPIPINMLDNLWALSPMILVFSDPAKKYCLKALKENVGLLKRDTIEKINALVLQVGQGYLKKKKTKK
jgi:hypothetical protein